MKKTLLALALAISCGATAQTQTTEYKPGVTPEGAVYFLPKTALKFMVQIEKTEFAPGEFCKYAPKYLRMFDVKTEKETKHRIVAIKAVPTGMADKTKAYAVKFDIKSVAANVALADDGTLLAINAGKPQQEAPASFRPAPKPQKANPRSYLSQEILACGSLAKMAEMTAQEIYDIRDSKNSLNRGEADYMPKDGEQLKLMLANLDKQERALESLFVGTEDRDTLEYAVTVCPTQETADAVLFRLSDNYGLVESDNPVGEPYYMKVEDISQLPDTPAEAAKKKKEWENGIYVNVPGKMKVTIYKDTQAIYDFETPAAQFGKTEFLSGDLFNKKYTTRLTLNPATGAIDKLDAELPK